MRWVCMDVCYSFFFFQAEDGIRDLIVTGVQTCALPISLRVHQRLGAAEADEADSRRSFRWCAGPGAATRSCAGARHERFSSSRACSPRAPVVAPQELSGAGAP